MIEKHNLKEVGGIGEAAVMGGEQFAEHCRGNHRTILHAPILAEKDPIGPCMRAQADHPFRQIGHLAVEPLDLVEVGAAGADRIGTSSGVEILAALDARPRS